MRHSPQLFALAALALLAGCATRTDFAEVHPSLVRDDMHDWIGRTAVSGRPGPASSFELTDDERALRDLAYPLLQPPHERGQWYSVAGEYGLIGQDQRANFDRAAYATRLLSATARSPSARYAQLTEDIRNDTTRLPQFFETAGRVIDVDSKRRKSLAYVSTGKPTERENALRRIQENARIVAMVRMSVAQRASSFRYALDRLVVATPSSQAVEAERALKQLQGGIARYRTHLPPSWQREQSLAAANN